MSEIMSFAQTVFESQPFTRFLGAKLGEVTSETAEIYLDIHENHKQQHGFVHGGVLSYLADNALTFAGGIALGGNALTSEYKINYVRPALGKRVIARASAQAAGKRQAVCRCELICIDENGDERLCALAQGTVVPAG